MFGMPSQSPPDAAPPRSGLPPSLLLVLPGLLLAFLVLRVVEPVKDPDTFWHIASGDHLRQTWDFVLDDPFGASATKPWILNQWLPQLAMSFADQVAGLAGVVWLTAFGALGILVAYYVSCRRRAPILVSTLVVAVAFLATSGSIAPRPQLVTFALTAVATDAWLRTAENRKPRWWLIPLTWLWACSHGMWFMGVAIGLVTITGLVVSGHVGLREGMRLGIIPVGSIVAAALTPVGPVLLTSPFQVSGVTDYITEWQPPSATSVDFLAALALIFLVVIDASRHAEGRAAHVLLLTGMAFFLAISYGRTTGVAAAIVAPLAASALMRLGRQHRESPRPREGWIAGGFAVGGLVLAAVLASAVAVKPALGANELDAEISALPKGTVVCNDWTDGGWLIWKHPNVRVTMDPRVELYSVDHIRSYANFIGARPGWQGYIETTGCSTALVRSDSPAAEAMARDEGWSRRASAGGYVLMDRITP